MGEIFVKNKGNIEETQNIKDRGQNIHLTKVRRGDE